MPAAGSASMDRRLEVTNGGGSRASGSDILLDLMVVPPVNGRCSSRSPARFRTEEVESGGGLDYKSRRSGEGSTAQQQQKRLTSALDSNLNELMVTTTTNTADTAQPRSRTRTKSESRAGEDRGARNHRPTENGIGLDDMEEEDTSRVLNLLKDPRRRPIEVDAREFRVLAEQLLVNEGGGGSGSGKPYQPKHNHIDTSPSAHHHHHPVVNGQQGARSASGRRKPNGYVIKNRSRSSDRVVEDDQKASVDKSQQKNHLAVDSFVAGDNLDNPCKVGPVKPGRRSRRETFELESLQTGTTALQQQPPSSSKKASTSSSTAAACNNNTRQQHREASNPRTEYTSDEKEWLKEKLLEEFERQELVNNKKSTPSSSSGGRAKRKQQQQHAAVDLTTAAYSPPVHQHAANGQAVARIEEPADKHQLMLAGRAGGLCRDTIAEMTSGLVEHYFLRAIPAQPAAAPAKLPLAAAAATTAVALSKGGRAGGGNSSHHHHHQTTSASRQKECCGGVSSSTIDEVVTTAAVATTTTVFLSEQHHSTCKASFCDVGGGSRHTTNPSGQLDHHLRSTSYSTSLTQLERGGAGCAVADSSPAARLSTTMPREKVVLLPDKHASPSLHASLPRPSRHSHSESCRESSVSMPGSPPPYVHPKSQEKDCSCPCDCRSSLYPSQEVWGGGQRVGY